MLVLIFGTGILKMINLFDFFEFKFPELIS